MKKIIVILPSILIILILIFHNWILYSVGKINIKNGNYELSQKILKIVYNFYVNKYNDMNNYLENSPDIDEMKDDYEIMEGIIKNAGNVKHDLNLILTPN